MRFLHPILGFTATLAVSPASANESGLRAEPSFISLSAVREKPAMAAKLTLHNPGRLPLAAGMKITGEDAAAFRITGGKDTLAPGETAEARVDLVSLTRPGLHRATLHIGDPGHACEIPLRGIGLMAYEGKNEPPLQIVAEALGIPVQVGGTRLELDVKAPSIGDGLPVRRFKPAPGKTVRITPLARFSPPGATPFGWADKNGALHELGRLADSSQRPDTHQSLFPSLAGGSRFIEFTPPAEPFAFYMTGHRYTAFTDPALPGAATIPHTVRVYPVTSFLGKPVTQAYLIACEEASNGDYQDAVFLLENASPE